MYPSEEHHYWRTIELVCYEEAFLVFCFSGTWFLENILADWQRGIQQATASRYDGELRTIC